MEADRPPIRTLEQRREQRAQELMPLFRVIDGARPVMESLIRDENWRRYLTILQGMLENAQSAKNRALASLSDPRVWAHDALVQVKADLREAQALIDAWTLAIELPASIVSGGEQANEIIKRFEKEHAATGQTEPQSA